MSLLNEIEILLIAGCVLIFLYTAFVEPFWFRVRKISLDFPHPDTPKMKVLHISDIHFCHNERRRIQFLQSLKTLQADLVLYTGDMIEPHGRRETLWEAVDGLVGKHGAFLVYGNHDYIRYTPRELFYDPSKTNHRDLQEADIATLTAGFRERGIEPLRNESRLVEINGKEVLITGIDDPFMGYGDVEKTFKDAPQALPTITLCHTPDPKTLDQIVDHGAHLILSGHTHGGQIRFPYIPALVRRCKIPRNQCRGLSRWKNAWLNISTGVGATRMTHIRLFCRPEVILFEIGPEGHQQS